MKIWILTFRDDCSAKYIIIGAYDSLFKAENAKDKYFKETEMMDDERFYLVIDTCEVK